MKSKLFSVALHLAPNSPARPCQARESSAEPSPTVRAGWATHAPELALHLEVCTQHVFSLSLQHLWVSWRPSIQASMPNPNATFPMYVSFHCPRCTGSFSPLWAHTVFYNSAFYSVVPGPAASVSAGNLLEMQIVRLCPRPTESDTLGVGPINLCFNKPSRRFRCKLRL